MRPTVRDVMRYVGCMFRGHHPVGQFCIHCGWFIP